MSHVKALEDIKETLTASTTKNDYLCASLQEKREEIAKLQLDLTNSDQTKEEMLRLTKKSLHTRKILDNLKLRILSFKPE